MVPKSYEESLATLPDADLEELGQRIAEKRKELSEALKAVRREMQKRNAE